MLTKDRLKPASRGDPSLLVMTVPGVASSVGDDVDVFCLPIDTRAGGMLLALPHDSISQEALLLGQSGTEELLFGPNTFVTVPLIEESEDLLSVVNLGIDAKVLVIDVNDDALLSCREYDPVTDHLAGILGFSHDHPNSLPEHTQLVTLVTEWLLGRSDDRTGFYTAQEDLAEPSPKLSRSSAAGQPPTGKKANQAKRVSNAAVAEQLTALSAQLQLLARRQDQLEKASGSTAVPAPDPFVGPTPKLPALSAALNNPSGISQTVSAKALQLIGPPPKVRAAPSVAPVLGVVGDEPYDALQPGSEEPAMAAAIQQQSNAVLALVAHLTSQAGDVLGDLNTTGQQSGTTKGVQRREKMQSDLASGSSNYFLQMMQQLHRRLHPSRPVPQEEGDLMSLSVLHYLERQGGYKNNRELGLVAWVLGHAIDAAAAGDFRHTKEVLALLMCAVEQATIDRGDWSLAFMLTLMEEPPIQVFQDRSAALVHHTRPFGPLVPPQWTAVCLSYLKDLEVLATRKTETTKRIAKPAVSSESPPVSQEPDREASPKRKPRFPKKPKAKQVADA